jgi:hypothetical protein
MLKVKYFYVGFEILSAVTMKNAVFCNMTSCSPIEVHTFWRNVLQATACRLLLAGYLLGLVFDPEDEVNTFL